MWRKNNGKVFTHQLMFAPHVPRQTFLFLPAQPHSVQDSKVEDSPVEDSPVEDNTGREDEAATSVASAAWAVGAEVLLQKKVSISLLWKI